jgi:hypothetical protein
MRATMTLPGKTEAGSAGMQPCRGIAWWAHRDDVHGRGSFPFALFPKHIGSKDPYALKIPARRAEYLLTESALSPFHAEPAHERSGGGSVVDTARSAQEETLCSARPSRPARNSHGRAQHKPHLRGLLPRL